MYNTKLLTLAEVELRKKIRSRLVQKTAPDTKPHTTQLTFNRIVKFCYDGQLPPLSGSSWNRNIKKKDQGTETNEGQDRETLDRRTLAAKNFSAWEDRVSERYNFSTGCAPTDADQERNSMSDTEKANNSLEKKPYEHCMSARSAQKIREKMLAFFQCSGTRRVFLTLTFINDVGDKQAVRLLNNFFTAVQKTQGRFMYVWVAERQPGTKRIHFHILIDRRLDIKYVNSLWVMEQYNAGICHPEYTFEEVKKRYDDKTLITRISKKTGKPVQLTRIQEILNPADVVSVHGVDGLAVYLTSYLTKSKGQKFQCRVWHCSRDISTLPTRVNVETDKAWQDAEDKRINKYVNKKTGQVYEPVVLRHEHALIIYLRNKKYFTNQYLDELNEINKLIIKEAYKRHKINDERRKKKLPIIKPIRIDFSQLN